MASPPITPAHTQMTLLLPSHPLPSRNRSFLLSPNELASSSARDPGSSSSSSSLSSSPTPSLYVTFKVLRLINSLRKRVQDTAHQPRLKKVSTRPSRTSRSELRQAIERETCAEIDRYLGRKVKHPETRSKQKHLPKLDVFEAEEVPQKSVAWLLREINRTVTAEDQSLETVAKDQQLFIGRRRSFHVKRLSINDLVDQLVLVKNLLLSIEQYPPTKSGVRTLVEGTEVIDSCIDETYLANLEHLLLCLQDQLLALLVEKFVEVAHRHLDDCQGDQRRHSEAWFFEFPDARHPLSTTWPWSIRPSLAVIWGVCWMFAESCGLSHFDELGNAVDCQGTIVIPREVLQHCQSLGQQQLHPHQSSMAQGVVSQRTVRRQPPLPTGGREPQRGSVAYTPPSFYHSGQQYLHLPAQHDPQTLVSRGLDGQAHTYPPAAPPVRAPSASTLHVPPTRNFVPQYTFDNAYAQQHTQQRFWPTSQEQDFSPPRAPVYPSLNIEAALAALTTPQDDHYYSDLSAPSSGSQLFGPPAPFDPQAFMNLQNPDMNTPVSEANQSPLVVPHIMEDQLSRKRSHSEMVDEVPQMQHQPYQRAVSVVSYSAPEMAHEVPDDSGSPPAEDWQSPRGSRSHKRPDPPMTADNKYYCDFSEECSGTIFERKCEWSKHMDKHDRPYRCPHGSCAKLQGFTYSGGLLRHEREVHGKHGGPKSQLMCPNADCKRHSGKGFTRKENLNEHIRRVHNGRPQGPSEAAAQAENHRPSHNLQELVIAAGADMHAESSMPQYAEVFGQEDMAPQAMSPPSKRRRSAGERSPSLDLEDMKHELKRLRIENALKDERLRRMEEADAQRNEQMRRMEEALRQTQIRVEVQAQMQQLQDAPDDRPHI